VEADAAKARVARALLPARFLGAVGKAGKSARST